MKNILIVSALLLCVGIVVIYENYSSNTEQARINSLRYESNKKTQRNTSSIITASSPKDLIDTYQILEREFNPAILDLYSDNAKIQNKRLYPTGKIRIIDISMAVYKDLLLQSLPLAKLKEDYSTYTDITYTNINDTKVSVTANRYSNLKKYNSPIVWLLEKRNSNWLIIEEIGESRP
jgi:hypothetical protein